MFTELSSEKNPLFLVISHNEIKPTKIINAKVWGRDKRKFPINESPQTRHFKIFAVREHMNDKYSIRSHCYLIRAFNHKFCLLMLDFFSLLVDTIVRRIQNILRIIRL